MTVSPPSEVRPPAKQIIRPAHGGDLSFAAGHHPDFKGHWLDLSTGINPVPYPIPEIEESAFTRLPDPAAVAVLCQVARTAYFGPLVGGMFLAVPGTEAALRSLPYLAPPGPVAVLGPSYRSHRDAWRAAGREPVEVYSIAQVPDDAVVAVFCNPNNPDGRLFVPDQLGELAERLEARGGFLVVDEAYGDLRPDLSLAAWTKRLRIVVLRSFGKFFGLPGLRLGFVMTRADLGHEIRRVVGDWPVSGPAVAIATAAFADADWIAATRQRLSENSDRLGAILARHRLRVNGRTSLFTLVESRQATEIHWQLAERGIWTRSFNENPDWIRIGLPGPGGFDRLDQALGEVMAQLDR